MPIPIFFNQLLIFMNLYQHATKSGFLIILFYGHSWFKNPAIWLAEGILAHISGIFFQNMGFVQQCKNFPLNSKNFIFGPFSLFLGQKYFFQKIWLSPTTPHGPLIQCWVPEKKLMSQIPRKLPDRRMARPLFIEPFWSWPGVQKVQISRGDQQA